ncbi:MAG: ABC transporter ATP-binding protein [Clostridia bacterium]
MTRPILEIDELRKVYTKKTTWLDRLFKKQSPALYALDGTSFNVFEGETLGLVGESGCGKSTLSRTIMRLFEPTDGTISFLGEDITHYDQQRLSKMRKEMQMVFQDPYSSLNPRMTVRSMLSETVRFHGICQTEKEIREYVDYLLVRVGLNVADGDKLPKAFSGGQRQRIGIARAIAVKPKLLIADEPVSALDVSVQAHILNLLQELRAELKLSMIFISHDLSVVKYISDRVAVMYLGKIVEIGKTADIFERPSHPYTKALLSAVPRLDQGVREQITLEGDPPSPYERSAGCSFYTRCPQKMDICQRVMPDLFHVSDSQQSRCHLVQEGSGDSI